MLVSCAKIHSIFRNLHLDLYNTHFNFDHSALLTENEEISTCISSLFITLANYESVLFECYQSLDPYRLTEYLFQLTRALMRLYRIASCDSQQSTAKQCNRLACFQAGVKVLEHGLKLLGVTPLSKV